MELACRNDRRRQAPFITWSPVDPSLTLSQLYVQPNPGKPLLPLWVGTMDFREVVTVSAYVHPAHRQYDLSALEFTCRSRVLILGKPALTDLKLSFPLFAGEAIAALCVGGARHSGSMVVTVSARSIAPRFSAKDSSLPRL